ncbi:MAG: polysaccharide biosynthesis/export family protein, partial [Sphingomonadaceae bacterium]|nr:polysaccharide biosynthesis/export family protein [Sphingomonadaceae bacterium]
MSIVSRVFSSLAFAAALLSATPAMPQTNEEPRLAAPVVESVTGVGQPAPSVLIDDQRGAEEQGRDDRTLRQQQVDGDRPAPFGSELFGEGATGQTAGLVDPSYVVRPGDQIAVTTYGLINEAAVLTVDTEGNISLPNLGPVRVAGSTAGAVNDTVNNAASRVYQDTVQIYATVLGAGQVQMFVAGPVERPGSHTGSSSDSVVTMLQRAGGIDADRGSYRHIIVRRGGRTIGEVDLYDFLLNGDLVGIDLRNNDVIVVGQQGPIVSVSGDARAPFTFEFADQAATGGELLMYARPRPEVTHVSVLGTRDGRPFNAYLTREEFATLTLLDGDRVGLEADVRAETFVVRVEGAHTGPSAFVVNRGENLGAVLARIPLDPLADTPMIHFERVSVAATQKQLLDESLARLERAIYTDPAPTTAIAEARAAAAAGI